MYNKAGLSETFKQVIHEESIRIAGASKAPDYTCRIGLNETASSDASDSSDLISQSLWSLPSLLCSSVSICGCLRETSRFV